MNPRCLNCLRRLADPSTVSIQWQRPPFAASFSTTPFLRALPPKKTSLVGKKAPPKKMGKVKRKRAAAQVTTRPPAPGERKALRKRIVLSNTNALEVPGLETLGVNNMSNKDMVGKMLLLSNPLIDSLRAVEAFKTTQGWSLFRSPAVLMRDATIFAAKEMEKIEESGKDMPSRYVIDGPRGSGKSLLQLQAMSMAFSRGWVVINIPDAMELTNAHTDYAPMEGTNPQQYIQPSYTAKLLGQISKANERVLKGLTVSMKHNLPVPVQANMSLDRFAAMGSSDPEIAWPFFQAFWKELMQPSDEPNKLKRPPVLLSLDNVPHIMRASAYNSPEMKPIHAHDLSLVRHFVDSLAGGKKFTNGGLVLAATTGSNRPNTPTLDHAIQLKGSLPKEWNPYMPVDERILACMKDVKVFKLGGLTKDEARGIMEYYAASGMMLHSVTERLVQEKWTLAGGGIIAELEKNSVRQRL